MGVDGGAKSAIPPAFLAALGVVGMTGSSPVGDLPTAEDTLFHCRGLGETTDLAPPLFWSADLSPSLTHASQTRPR